MMSVLSPRTTLAAMAVLVVTLVGVQAQGPSQGGGRGGQQQAPVDTGPKAPEVYKNIQVLKDVPASQIDVTMRYIAAATGMQCRNCHVQDETTGEFTYEKDDMRSKQTARRMIQLVETVNAGDFGARINCGTCHAGHNQPQGLRLAAMATPEEIAQRAAFAARQGGQGRGFGGPPQGGRGQGGRGRGQQGPPPPPVDEVLTKYFTAIGGDAAIAKIQSLVVTGSMTDRFGATMPFAIQEKAPGFFLSTLTQKDGKEQTGFDGAKGWTTADGKPADLAGFPLEYAMRLADLSLPSQLKSMASTLQAGRTTRLPDGPEVNVLQGTTSPGTTERFYFDSTSGLLVRRSVTTRTPLGFLPEQIDYADYRAVSGVKMPFTVTRGSWNARDTYKASSIKANTAIADSVFTRPKG